MESQQVITLLSKEDISEMVLDAIRKLLGETTRDNNQEGPDNIGPWSLKVAAERTGFSVSWFKKQINEGLIPPQKMGGKFVVYQRDLDNAVRLLKFE